MASACSVCPKGKKRKKTAPSLWCPVCNDLLCQKCTEHHKRQKDTRNHSTISYEDYQKLPPFIWKIKNFCTDHNKRYTEFCRSHDTPICIMCRKKPHQKCDVIPKIKDIVPFEATMLMEIKCRILKQIANDRNKYHKQLNITNKEFKADFVAGIDNLIQQIQNFKHKTLYKMDVAYNKLANDISNSFKTVQYEEKEPHDILDQKDEILKYASNYEMLIILKEMETIVKELSNVEKPLENELQLQVNETIEDMISAIQSLGDIQVTMSPSAVSTQNTEARYVEVEKEDQTRGPELQLQQTINLKKDHYYNGCCILPSGLIVLADKGESGGHDCQLLIHNPEGSLRSIIKIDKSDGVWDVAPVDDHHIAVSHPWSGTISIIDVDSDQVVRKLKIEEKGLRGLFCLDRDIVYCVRWKGLFRVNIDKEEVETVVKDERVGYGSHVEVTSSLICYTCPHSHIVTVLDTQYNVIFRYKDETVLRDPTGVTIDDHCNIYVTGCDSNNIVLLSPDGKTSHQLLGKDDGLNVPTAVHYDNCTKKLVVVNLNGPAFIYSVK